MSQQVPIRIAHVQKMLRDGKTREEIGEFYGLSKADVRRLFQHEDLKGKKTHKKPGFKIIEEPILDDTTGRENSSSASGSSQGRNTERPEPAGFNYGNREPEI